MARPKANVEEAPQGEIVNDRLKAFLKSNKDDHYNFEEEIYYKVSSGSLNLDFVMGGGFSPGLHRFIGMNEGGKTSEALEVMKNFLKTVKDSRGLIIKAEGRLGKEVQERSGIEFVSDPDSWKDGNCFVFESNIFETVSELMLELVKNNPENKRYLFILDSVDGLMPKNDAGKTL